MSLDDSHTTRKYELRNLLDGNHEYGRSDLRRALDSSFSSMHKSMSMIELSNLHLVHDLNDELDALSDASTESPQLEVKSDDGDDFFFYDRDDPAEQSAKTKDESKEPFEISFQKGTTPSESLIDCTEKKMRRVQSFAGFQHENVSNRFVKAINTVSTIAEEDELVETKSNDEISTSNMELSTNTSKSQLKIKTDHKHCPLKKPKKSALKYSSDEIHIDRKLMKTYSSKDLKKYGALSCCSTSQCSDERLNASISSTNSNEFKITRNISFSTLEVRTYDLTLGDNPGGSSGPPISLDWNYNESKTVDLEDYEAKRLPRRSRKDLHLDINTRYFSLASQFTASELKKATVAARQTRIRRKKSYSTTSIEPLQEAMESTGKKLKKFMRKKKKQ